MKPEEQRERETFFNEQEQKENPCRDWRCDLEKIVMEMRRREYKEGAILGIVVDAFNKC